MLASLFQIAGLAASVAIGLVFLAAGLGKLRHRALLPGVIANYRLLPAALVTPVAWLLPPLELLVAAGLIVGFRPVAPVVAILLLLVFAAGIAINIRRGRRHIDCGCGQAGLRQTLGWGLVVRNLLLAIVLVPSIGMAAPAVADRAVGALAGVAAFLLLQMFSTINALPARPPGRSWGRGTA